MKNRIVILACCLMLNIADVWAACIVHVSPSATTDVTWAEFRHNQNVRMSLVRGFEILKLCASEAKKELTPERITLKLDPGRYELKEVIYLGSDSSGTKTSPVTIKGPDDGEAIISGGRIIDGFIPINDNELLSHIPVTARTSTFQANIEMLFTSGYISQDFHGAYAKKRPVTPQLIYRNQPMTLSRWPNQVFAKISSIPDGKMGLSFNLLGANVSEWLNESELLATGYWFANWADATIPITNIDANNDVITLAKPGSTLGIKMGQPVFIQNALAELDQPGEWYLDKKRAQVYFWPPDNIKSNDVEISFLEKLLIIDNAEYIHIDNVILQNNRGDAISIKGGNHIAITNSTIRNVGNNAIVMSGVENGVDNITLENIGETGIELIGGNLKTLTPAGLYVTNSKFSKLGLVSRTYSPAVAISGVGNRVIGNVIHDGPHSAILFSGNDHQISHNEIYNVCLETDDAAAIYAGRDWVARGTTITNNYIHDISRYTLVMGGDAIGIYLDDQFSGTTIRDNLFKNVHLAIAIGGGRDNTIENNIFINGNNSIILDKRGETWHKTIQNDLMEKLATTAYNSPAYVNKYPHIGDLLQDEPSKAKYNRIKNNFVFGGAKLKLDFDMESDNDIDEPIVADQVNLGYKMRKMIKEISLSAKNSKG